MNTGRSAIYRGTVMHHRLSPVKHRFVYDIRSFLFDIDELPILEKQCRLFSLNRFNLFSLNYRDLNDGSGQAPRTYLENLLQEHGISTPLTRAELLCYPRMLGFSFNPLTVYYCYDHNQQLFAALYEVSNTFGERHSYLIPVTAGSGNTVRHSCDKNFYVSPFMAMQQRYHFRLGLPAETLSVGIRLSENGSGLFNALFQGSRQAFNDWQLLRSFVAMPLMTVKVVAAIHWQALKLWLKGLAIQPRPAAPNNPVSIKQ